MVVAKVWIMETKFVGAPKPSDFAIKEETLSPIKEGEALVEAVWWSVDPYNRAYVINFPAGTPMIGFQVAKVLETKTPKFPVGSLVIAHTGWRTHSIINDKADDAMPAYPLPQQALAHLPISLSVGCLGMPGMTAYFGFLECCNPKAGDTVVVNAGAGAVGSMVGQIAKIKGCKVIGYAGTDEKVEYMKSIGFDHAFNYKTEDLDQTLKQAAPGGVDCFFDNVGGQFAVTVYQNFNHGARVCQCGAISSYNAITKPNLPDFLSLFIGKEATLKGFHASSYIKRFPEGIAQMAQWIHSGQIKFRETVYHKFEQMPQALIDLLNGVNIGKVVIEA